MLYNMCYGYELSYDREARFVSSTCLINELDFELFNDVADSGVNFVLIYLFRIVYV